MSSELAPERLKTLIDELENFTDIARVLAARPGEIPRLPGVDIFGFTLPLSGVVGGDHIVYVDFNRRYDLSERIAAALQAGRKGVAAELEKNRHRAGILVADVAGHRLTDAMVAAMLHQAFLLGAAYELEINGEITTRLFQQIKRRFYESLSIKKLVALIYGEISDEGRFRYLSAGHTPPLVFSREFGRLMPLGPDRTASDGLVGLFPAEPKVPVNEIELLMPGDILLLATDGLTDHADGAFLANELTGLLDRLKDRTAAGIGEGLRQAVLDYAPPADDVTVVIVKKL